MKQAFIMSRRQADGGDFGICPLISITEHREEPVNVKGAEILRCQFPDSTDPRDIPDHEMSRILNFLERHKDVDAMYIHCYAGLSRSAAVALFCAEKYGAEVDLRGKFPNLEVVRKLRHLSAPAYALEWP